MGAREVEDDIGMVMEVECVVCIRNLGGRLVLIFIMAGVLVCVVGEVLEGVVFCREHSLLVMEVQCLGGGLCASGRWYLQLEWEICDGDGNGGGRYRIGGDSCCIANLGLVNWEDVFLLVFRV